MKRFLYFITTLIIMVLGLLSRKFMFIFPESIAPFVGDSLWAMMVYFGFRFLFPRISFFKAFLIGIIFSFGIEISQLYQGEFINSLRNTTLGGLILGHGFLWRDLVSYFLGIVVGVGIDKVIRKLI